MSSGDCGRLGDRAGDCLHGVPGGARSPVCLSISSSPIAPARRAASYKKRAQGSARQFRAAGSCSVRWPEPGSVRAASRRRCARLRRPDPSVHPVLRRHARDRRRAACGARPGQRACPRSGCRHRRVIRRRARRASRSPRDGAGCRSGHARTWPASDCLATGSESRSRRAAFSTRCPARTRLSRRWRCTTSTISRPRLSFTAPFTARSRQTVLLNLDAAVSEDTRLNALVFDRWAHRMNEHGITDSQARSHFAAWSDEDRYFPLEVETGCAPRSGLR